MDVLKQTRRYSKLRGDTLGRTLWRTGFRRSYGPDRRWTRVIDRTCRAQLSLAPHRSGFLSDKTAVSDGTNTRFFPCRRKVLSGGKLHLVLPSQKFSLYSLPRRGEAVGWTAELKRLDSSQRLEIFFFLRNL